MQCGVEIKEVVVTVVGYVGCVLHTIKRGGVLHLDVLENHCVVVCVVVVRFAKGTLKKEMKLL
jgi:hypothetical protein